MDGNAWEGYQWVDGWPVTPPRQQQAPAEPAAEPVNEPEHEPEMVVDNIISVVDTASNTIGNTSNAIVTGNSEQVNNTQNVTRQDWTGQIGCW
jgi:hypothetical protein